MGEAINRILKRDPSYDLPNAKEIINTRNRVIHSYDNVTSEFLWGLVIKHIPILKQDVERLLSEDENKVDKKLIHFIFLWVEEVGVEEGLDGLGVFKGACCRA